MPCQSLQMLAQLMQMTAAGIVMMCFATFPAPADIFVPKGDFATSFNLSRSVSRRSCMVHLRVAGLLHTWPLTVCIHTAPYTTSTEAETSEEEWRNLKSCRDLWCPLCLLFSLWLIFSLSIYRQLTPGTPSLWHSIPSVFHGSLARLIRRSKARKTSSLWASWISLASRTFRSGFCLLQDELVLEMSVPVGGNFGWFLSCLG